MRRKILVIQNPVSGTIQNKMNFDRIINKLRKRKKYDLTIKATTSKEGADDIIKKENELYDIIFVCGGDGTLNQVITEVSTEQEKNKPIMYLPLGTTNDFARSLRIAKKNNKNMVKRKKCDTGKVNKSQYFNYIAAAGLFTKASYSTSRLAKKIFGRIAYLFTGFGELFNIKEYEATVVIDDKQIEDKFIYMGISNSYSIGGIKVFKDNELELNDGKFEILLIKKPKNIFKLAKLGIKILSQNHNDENIIFLQAPSVKITTKEGINWTFDGENSGKYREINVSNIRNNVEFIF